MHSIISNNTFWSYTLVFAHHTLKTIQFIELQCILKYFYVIHWTLQCNRSLITPSPHTQNNTQCLNSEQCILQWSAIHYYLILFTTHSKQYILHFFALHCVLWISMHCKKHWFISYNPIIHWTHCTWIPLPQTQNNALCILKAAMLHWNAMTGSLQQ